MREEILSNLENPVRLESLYRKDKPAFKEAFENLYPQLQHTGFAAFWNARLNFSGQAIPSIQRKELLVIVLLSLAAGFIAQLPAIFNIDPEFYYTRNIGFILFPALSAYFVWNNGISLPRAIIVIGAILVAASFINFLPADAKSDTLVLSCIHLVFFLWFTTGVSFAGNEKSITESRMRYLRLNGDIIVMTTLIIISGVILTAATIALFSLIGLNINEFYMRYIVVSVLPAAPIVGTYLTQTNPGLVGKVSPLIAKIFSPLVLITLIVYLGAMIYSGKDPYNNRDFLLMFNGLLAGVMAIIFFSVAEASRNQAARSQLLLLFVLCVVTVIVNGVALSAIIYRISEWGITPNRAAVLGGNILMLANLVLIAVRLEMVIAKKIAINEVGKAISIFIPFYFAWVAMVTFLFPLIFGFK